MLRPTAETFREIGVSDMMKRAVVVKPIDGKVN
jgi:hypothetical protein